MTKLGLLLSQLSLVDEDFRCVLTTEELQRLKDQILSSPEFAWVQPWREYTSDVPRGGGLKQYLWFRKRQATDGMVYQNGEWQKRKSPMTPAEESAWRVIWTQQFIDSGGWGRWSYRSRQSEYVAVK